jgi:hypothetical protein
MENTNTDINNSFIYKVANSIVGTKRDFRLLFFLSLISGIVYTFRIWDHPAILILFGILLPCIYTVILYLLNKKTKLIETNIKIINLIRTKLGIWLFMSIDILILIATGYLILIGTIDYIIIRFFSVLFVPLSLLLSIRVYIIRNNFEIDDKPYDSNE